MPHLVRLLFCLALGVPAQHAVAQIKAESTSAAQRFGDTTVTRYRVGASVTASRGAVRDILATFAVPLSCPEQEVSLLEEDISEYITSSDYRVLRGDTAKQMVIRARQLPNKAEAHAILTFEVRTRTILPPERTNQLTLPKKPPRDLKLFLGKSPMIETNHSKLKRLSREIFADREFSSDWERVEALYDHVQDSIEYREQDDKSALVTLREGHGDCQNISALFIALCRTNKIPARLVWVHEHAYPEFCLIDEEGTPQWFPCESSGARAFGEMPLARVIMAKGDNFRVPEQRKALRYAAEFLSGKPAAPGGGAPSHRFIRERL